MLTGITLLCFTASYAVALAAEVAKLAYPAAWLRWAAIVATGAGLVAHGIYLTRRIWPLEGESALLADWYQWCLIVAGVVAIAYLVFKFTHPTVAAGLFFLPIVMALIGIAWLFQGSGTFRGGEARHWWGLFHGLSLLAGTVGVLIAFAAGIMYLVQAYRLRAKLPPTPGFELPSLEWLQSASSRALIVSTICLAVGLLSGVCMNLTREPMLPWTDPVIVSSGVLFLWLLAATGFELFYRPAREGQKVAYLTIAQFIFLCLALAFALWAGHARVIPQPPGAEPHSEAGRPVTRFLLAATGAREEARR